MAKHALLGIVASIALCLTLFVHLPIFVLVRNSANFNALVLGEIGTFYWLGAAALAVIIGAFWLAGKLRPQFAVLLSVLATAVWLYGFILVEHLPVLNGEESAGDFFAWTPELIGMGLLVAAALAAWKAPQLMAIVLVASQVGLATTVVGEAMSYTRKPERTDRGDPAAVPRYSTRSNLVVIILDAAQSDVAASVLESDDRLRSEFDGFVFYRDTLSTAPSTYVSLPTMHSGMVFDPPGDVWEFYQEAVAGRSFLADLAQSGLDVSLVSPAQGICPAGMRFCGFPVDLMRGTERIKQKERYKLADLVAVRSVPYSLKRWIFNDGAWLFAGLDNTPSGSAGTVSDHVEFLGWMAREIEVGDGPGTVKFVHSNATHAPHVFDAGCNYLETRSSDYSRAQGQVACALSSLSRYFDALRSKSVFENTAVIIVADHGSGQPSRYAAEGTTHRWATYIGSANPLLMVKAAGAQEPLQFSDEPRSLSQLGAIACSETGACDPSRFPLNRKHILYDWKDAPFRSRQFSLEVFEVDAPVYKPESWKSLIKIED